MSATPAPLPHRVRRLRWQARADGAAQALALRQRLHAGHERLQQALGEALDALDDGRWLEVPRIALQLDPDWLQVPGPELVRRLRQQLEAQWPAARHAPAATADGRAAVEPGRGEPALADGPELPMDWLLDYLAGGLLPWALGGLAPEALRPRLQATAAALARDGRVWRSAPSAADPAALLGWWQRWWALWPGQARDAWWQTERQRQPSAAHGTAAEGLTRADALARWLDSADLSASRRATLQALWLALRSAATQPAAAAMVQRSANAGTAAALIDALWPEGRLTEVPHRPLPVAPLPRGADLPAAERPATEPARHAQRHAQPGWMVPLAGLVLLHPWLPALLRACQVTTPSQPGEAWEPTALARAAGLLRALALPPEGRHDDGEWALPVVKLLLGCPPDRGWPLPTRPPTPDEQTEVDALLSAAITHWSALGRTGADALRSSFLQRPGLLSRQGEGWLLRPQPEAFDLLLGRLPWGLGWIRLPWMAQALQVEWHAP